MSAPEDEPAGDPEVHYITSVEEWEALAGKPDPEQTRKLAEQGVMNFLRNAPCSDHYDDDK